MLFDGRDSSRPNQGSHPDDFLLLDFLGMIGDSQLACWASGFLRGRIGLSVKASLVRPKNRFVPVFMRCNIDGFCGELDQVERFGSELPHHDPLVLVLDELLLPEKGIQPGHFQPSARNGDVIASNDSRTTAQIKWAAFTDSTP